MMKGTYHPISRDRLNGMLTADAGRYEYLGEQTDEKGWRWSCWQDCKTDDLYAVRQPVNVHMGFNSSPQEKIDELVQIVEEQGFASATWGVTGRTKHALLAQELAEKLPQYKFDIGYNYECIITKRNDRRNEE